MPAAPPIPLKTPLGVEAQRKRTADLGQRHRTILFLVDGRRTLSEVLALATQAGAATTHFEDLVRLGYIEVPQPEPPSRSMPLDESELIADSLEIDVPPLLLDEEAVVPIDQAGNLAPAPPPPAPLPAPSAAAVPVPVAAPAPVAVPVPAPTAPAAAAPRPGAVARSGFAPLIDLQAAWRPAVPARSAPASAAPARTPAPVPAPAPAPRAEARPAASKPPPAPVQPKPAKVRAPTIISSHGLAPAGKPTTPTRTLRVIPPATHDEEDVLGEVRACLLETLRLDGASFGRRMAARVKSADDASDFIGLVWELERETSHARRSREGLWNLQRARELLGLGNTLVAEDSRPNWPDSE